MWRVSSEPVHNNSSTMMVFFYLWVFKFIIYIVYLLFTWNTDKSDVELREKL